MLSTSPPKTYEHVVSRICASLHGDFENRLSHAGIRDFEEACRDFIVASLEARLRKFPADPFQSGDDRFSFERKGKTIRNDAS